MVTVLADNSKVNTSGKIEEFGVIRHTDVFMCGVSALAFHAMNTWSLDGTRLPSFVSDFDLKTHGKFGYREWWEWVVFRGNSYTKPMAYDSE